jgi:holo-[acyl-carrier protein] synthase
MPEVVNGIDLVEIGRIAAAIERHGDRFLQRVFTAGELLQTEGKVESLAARFAAKEAAAKALGCGIGDVGWLEIEVLRGENRQPELHLHGNARQIADKRGLAHWAVSLSHTETFAIAMVTALGAS